MKHIKMNQLLTYTGLLLMLHGMSVAGLTGGPQAAETPLVMRIIAAESTVCSGSVLKVEVDIRNTSANPVSIRSHGISGVHFQARRPIPNQSLPEYDSLDKNSAATGEDVAPIVLQPGTSHRYSVSLKDDFFKAEGFYKVSLDYDGHPHRGTPVKPGAPRVFDGHIESNWLIFEVQECSTESRIGPPR
jgi:hypothetical protein